jgi:hypothetical protein
VKQKWPLSSPKPSWHICSKCPRASVAWPCMAYTLQAWHSKR